MKRSWQNQFSFIGGQTVTRTYSNMQFMSSITFKAKVVTVVPFEVKLFRATECAMYSSKVQAN